MASPYFNSDKKLIRLTEALYQQLETVPSRESLFEVLFPDEEFAYFKISNLLSYITGHLERFLAMERMQDHPQDFERHLLMAAQEREIDFLFQHGRGYSSACGQPKLFTVPNRSLCNRCC